VFLGERLIMTKYNLLFIDADEHIAMSKQIECSNDEQALNIAAQEAGEHRAIQVWQGERPVRLVSNLHRTE
jgi:uncharacterized protein YunC (DUF1805 family)